MTIALGASLVTSLVMGRAWPVLEITHVHAAWGLAGWALLLLASEAGSHMTGSVVTVEGGHSVNKL